MGIICIACFGMVNYAGASFLKAQKFPETIDDLSFVERMRIRAEGYDALETVYDANGRCVSGCAYAGITLQEEEDMIAQATAELQAAIALHEVFYPKIEEPDKQDVAQTQGAVLSQSSQQQQPQQQSQQGGGVISTAEVGDVCAAAKVSGFSAPVGGNVVVVSDFGLRNVNVGTTYHRAIDLRAPYDASIYSGADGVVDFVGYEANGYGNYVKIKHNLIGASKPLITLYAHLSSVNVSKGQTVSQGQLIGKSGNTGRSGGAHLHYEVRYDDVKVDPLGAYVKPVLKGVYNHETSKGKNFLSGEYCFENNITSSRLQMYKNKPLETLRKDFPCCRGFCH